MTKSKATDVTGRQREAQLKAVAEEQASRANELSMVTAAKIIANQTEIEDFTKKPDVPTILDEVESVGVTLAEDTVVIRILEDLDQMTFGAGNFYSFKAGRKAKVSKDLGNHLVEKGYASYYL